MNSKPALSGITYATTLVCRNRTCTRFKHQHYCTVTVSQKAAYGTVRGLWNSLLGMQSCTVQSHHLLPHVHVASLPAPHPRPLTLHLFCNTVIRGHTLWKSIQLHRTIPT